MQRKLSRGYTYGDAAQGGYVPSMNGSGPEPEDDGALPAAVNVDGYYTSLLGRVQEVGVTSEYRLLYQPAGTATIPACWDGHYTSLLGRVLYQPAGTTI